MILVIAQVVCKLPQCEVCRDLEPWSWQWILAGCWAMSGDVLAAGLSLTAALLIGRGYLWALGRR